MQKTKAVIALQGSQHWTVVSKLRKLISTAEIQPSWILKVHGKILSTPYFRTSVRPGTKKERSWKLPQVYPSNPEGSSKKWETASHTAQLYHHIQRHRYTLPSLAGAWEMSFLLSHRQQLIWGRSLWKEDLCHYSGTQHTFLHWWQKQKVFILHHLYIISLPNPLAIFIYFESKWQSTKSKKVLHVYIFF